MKQTPIVHLLCVGNQEVVPEGAEAKVQREGQQQCHSDCALYSAYRLNYTDSV